MSGNIAATRGAVLWGVPLLATVMLGALTAHFFILHVAPTAPVVLFLLSGFVVWGRRKDLAWWSGMAGAHA